MSATTTTAAVLPAVQLNVNYGEVKNIVKDFLTGFKDTTIDIDEEIEQVHSGKYMNVLQQVANRQKSTVYIELDDLKSFCLIMIQKVQLRLIKHVLCYQQLFPILVILLNYLARLLMISCLNQLKKLVTVMMF